MHVDFKPGANGAAKLVVEGKGEALSSSLVGFPSPPLGLPLRVQFQALSGGCWETSFTTSGVRATRKDLGSSRLE